MTFKEIHEYIGYVTLWNNNETEVNYSRNLPAGGKLSKGNEKYKRKRRTNRVIASHACFSLDCDIG